MFLFSLRQWLNNLKTRTQLILKEVIICISFYCPLSVYFKTASTLIITLHVIRIHDVLKMKNEREKQRN